MEQLPNSILHRLADRLPIADQRALRWLDPRFGGLVGGDWAMPLLHRLARLLTHLEERRDNMDLEGACLQIQLHHTAPDRAPLGAIYISCRDAFDDSLLPTGQFSVLTGFTLPYLEESGDRRHMLGTVDRLVHLERGPWSIELGVRAVHPAQQALHIIPNISDPTTIASFSPIRIAYYLPPLYASEWRYSSDPPGRRVRPRLE